MPGYKIFTRQDGQQIVKVYLGSRFNTSLIRQPYCYLSIEDFDLINGSLFATRDLYTAKSLDGKAVGIHRIVVAKKEGLTLDSFDVADHINGVPLDNTRPNLRSFTYAENANNCGYHYSENGNDRRLGLDILELEMRGIISVELGDEIYNKRIDDLNKKHVKIIDYLSFAFWFRDDDLHFYAPDLYDYIPVDMLRELLKNTYTEYHRLDVLDYSWEQKEELKVVGNSNQGSELEVERVMKTNKAIDGLEVKQTPENHREQILRRLYDLGCNIEILKQVFKG